MNASLSGIPLSALLSLVLVVVAIPVVLWGTRRLARWPGSQGPLRLRGSVALGPRERLVLVEVGGRCLLLGVTAQSIQKLVELDECPPDLPATPFSELLRRAPAPAPPGGTSTAAASRP